MSERRNCMKAYSSKLPKDYPIAIKPMGEIAGYPVRPGMFDINGVTVLPRGVNFTIHTHYGNYCELLLFHRGEAEPYAVLPFPDEYKIGDVYSMIVFGLDIYEFEYAYRIDGPYQPEKGLLFKRENVILDPYARAIAGWRGWGDRKVGAYHARVVEDKFDWGDMPQSNREMCDLVIYELHVRGFTRHPSSGVEHRGTFAGLMEKIPYLKELGVNAVELMPIFEFDEMRDVREVDGQRLLDYWGYNPVGFFAPNTSYAATEEYNHEGRELKELIKALHDNGIEVILDVVFNHTAEGNENGPSFCFKGLDNKVYYMLTPDGNYYNFSGCGNTLNCNHPIVKLLILECLRYWTVSYRVDGFRFDLASILGRNEDGSPMNNPPLLRSLSYDPVLSNVKLIAEAWDAGGMYQVGSFPASRRWAEWNGRYRDSVRGFLKGENWEAWNAAWSIAGSGDIYGKEFSDDSKSYAGYNSCVNFLTCHDGFTLYDLYSYNQKHNEENGWDNTDGANDNRSWNCGVEGETTDEEILKLRRRLVRNACAVLLASRGTPMFFAGDEFCNTQYGNNNSYCQDNEISWLDWSRKEQFAEIFEFFKFMIAFRKEHTVIRKRTQSCSVNFPEISLHGLHPWNIDYHWSSRVVGVMFAGRSEDLLQNDIVYLAVNAYWEEQTFELPLLPAGMRWRVAVDTWLESGLPEDPVYVEDKWIRLHPRSVQILVVEEE